MQNKDSGVTDSLRNIVDALVYSPHHVRLVFVFGSYAKGRFTRESDIDIGVLFEKKLSTKEYLDLKGNVDAVTPYTVDLVMLNDASDILQFQVIKYGNVLFSDGSFESKAYKATAIGKYQDFKRSRRVLEEKLLVRVQ